MFNRDYLIARSTLSRKEFIYGGEIGNEKLSEKEIKIISRIKDNARFSSLEIAEKLNVDPRTIISTLKSLEKKKILQGSTVFIDLKKLGLQLHKLCISLETQTKESYEKLISFLKLNPTTIHLIKSLGSWELEVEIEESDIEKIHNYINEIKREFPQMIKKIDLVTITEELKLDFFPNFN